MSRWKDLRFRAFYAMVLRPSPSLRVLGGESPWTIDASALGPHSVVYSGGAGNDVSFEVELARQYGCEVHLFDPSETGRRTALAQGAASAGIEYHALGLAGKPGARGFRRPIDSREGSYTMCAGEGVETSFPCTCVGAFMRERGHRRVDLLKLDIEGFEFEVIASLLAERLNVGQICVEFHHRAPFPHTRWTAIRCIVRLLLRGYRLVHLRHCDHTFVLRSRTPDQGEPP
jgi:FkbM family methyltransferase